MRDAVSLWVVREELHMMRTRAFWLISIACIGLTLSGCSGLGGKSHKPGKGDEGDTAGATSDAGGGQSQSSTGEDDAGDGWSSSGVCTPKSCAKLGATCGPIADGCGGIVNCGACGQFEECGLFEPNVCGDVTQICTVEKPTCGALECGRISDGCNGSVDCGACGKNEICGLNTPFMCDAQPAPDPENCPGKIASCESVGVTCGKIGNGCGGVIDCDFETGGCDKGELCGLKAPGVCAAPPTCTALTAAMACAGTCGMAANGCGQVINCETSGFACPVGTECGGGSVPGKCGTPGTQVCLPDPTAMLCAGKCGKIGNGCGGIIDCSAPGNGGVTCDADKWCGGGGVPSKCGHPACAPVAQAVACTGKCGKIADGCGGIYTCSSCTNGKVCGFSTPNVCGAPVCAPLAPKTACAGKCGKIGDGCGGFIDCSAAGNGGVACSGGTWCGGSGGANTCGKPACTKKDCATLGFTCGSAPDGCGGVLNCGGATACPATATCSGVPATCVTAGGGGTTTCPLCQYIPTCSAASKTVITGRVTTPDGEVGVPNAYVYILKSNDATTLPTISQGVSGGSCERCADEDLGPLLASSLTTHTGAYRIETNIPVGSNFTLVVKAGKWRRAMVVPSGVVSACKTTALPESYSRLAANSSDGLGAHLPKIAISTGRVDEMECVFFKAGISASEFTVPSQNGRIHMYRSTDVYRDPKTNQDEVAGGSRMGSNCTCSAQNPTGSCTSETTVNDSQLFATQTTMDAYDVVVMDCEGHAHEEAATADARMREYVNKGGRLFASHWSYTWLHDNASGANVGTNVWQTGLSGAANFSGAGSAGAESDIAYLSLGRPRANTNKVQNFSKWLSNEGAATLTTDNVTGAALTGQFNVTDPRDLAASANAGSDEWVYRTVKNGEARPHAAADTSVQQLSFNTPLGANAANVCGRVAYSGFHVAKADNNDSDDFFPCVCEGTTLTAQEKVLLYMLFDLSACVSTDGPTPPPACTPTAKATACAGKCGYVSDGCGGVIDCGATCRAGQICNPTTNVCVDECKLIACADVGANCGFIPNGCGETVNCGTCRDNQVCGLYQANLCSVPVCTPTTKTVACTGKCGSVPDGCGNVIDCGTCVNGQICGAAGPNLCGVGTCTPLDCAALNIGCGMSGNGCNGTIDCKPCVLPDTCGGGGVPSQCGHPTCKELSCADLNAQCGFIGDGCGGAVDCGPCQNNGVCGGVGPNLCGGTCNPLSCADSDAECGLVGDGCGALVNCGICPKGKVCGAVEANKCGDGPSCPPTTCAAQKAECGMIGDGCGAALNCGKCVAPESCGGAGEANQCGEGDLSCVPGTCEGQMAECGALGDGCGGLLDCGACPPGLICGGISPNQCAAVIQ